MIEWILIILLGLFPLGVMIFIIIPFLFGASFEASDKDSVERMIRLSGVKKGERVVDLGSGDGRLVIEFAKKGAYVMGYEINPLLVLWSRMKIKKEKLEDNAKIIWKSFWKVELDDYDIISVFQISYLMGRLEEKLKGLKKGSKIISNNWKFPNWPLKKQEEKIYLYVKT